MTLKNQNFQSSDQARRIAWVGPRVKGKDSGTTQLPSS